MSVADKAGKKDSDKNGDGSRRSRSVKGGSTTVSQVRTRVAQVVWLFFVVAAVFLAVGALCIALGFNRHNPLVEFFLAGADFFDLDIFSRRDGHQVVRRRQRRRQERPLQLGARGDRLSHRRADRGEDHPAVRGVGCDPRLPVSDPTGWRVSSEVSR